MSETEYTSIRVPKEVKEQAAEAKHEDEKWEDYILRCAEEPKALMSEDEIREIVREEVGRMP